jgi:hypothetical protein
MHNPTTRSSENKFKVPRIYTQNKVGVKINKASSMCISGLNYIQYELTHLKQTIFHQQHSILQRTQISRTKQNISAAHPRFYHLFIIITISTFRIKTKIRNITFSVCNGQASS